VFAFGQARSVQIVLKRRRFQFGQQLVPQDYGDFMRQWFSICALARPLIVGTQDIGDIFSRAYFPLVIPSVSMNLCIGLTATPVRMFRLYPALADQDLRFALTGLARYLLYVSLFFVFSQMLPEYASLTSANILAAALHFRCLEIFYVFGQES
jgi:hypothetical protein